MRLRTIILEFIKQSYPMIICAFFMGGGLMFFKKRISDFDEIIERNVSRHKLFQLVMILCAIAFIWWGYILKSAFYTPYNTGVEGDNFYFVSKAIRLQNYYYVRHIIFPWIGEQFILFAKKAGFLNPQDRLFPFYAFELTIWPVRILAVIGLIYIYKLFRLLKFSFTKQIQAILFLATSFGYWLWAIQPTALGIAMAFQCIALYYSVKMIICKNKTSFFLAPIFIMLCLFSHVCAAYFVVGLSLFMAVYVIVDVCKKIRKAFVNLMIYYFTLMAGGAAFLYIVIGALPISNFSIRSFIQYMGHVHYQKPLEIPGIKEFLIGAKNNIAVAMTHLFGFWGPQTAFDYILIFIILSVTIALFIYLFINLNRVISLKQSPDRWIVLMLLFIIIIPFIFFTFIYNASQYYVIALVPHAILFLFLIFKIDMFYKKGFATALLCCLIPASLLYNAFSSTNVLRGLDFRQPSSYKKLDALYRKYPKEKIYFFETYNEYEGPHRLVAGRKVYFFQEPLTTEYAVRAFWHCFSPAFPNIEWIYAGFDNETIMDMLNKNDGRVIVGFLSYAKMKDNFPAKIKVFITKDNQTNQVFYILEK